MTTPSRHPPPDEDAWVARALSAFPAASPGVLVGPGHDCAVLDVDGARVVVTSDVVVDGVHFHLATCGAEAAGAKALLVNLSDLAATGAIPVAFEIGIVLPRRSAGEADLEGALYRGLAAVAERHACPLAGGDTNVADAPLMLAVTAIGRPGPSGRLLDRSGARVGDVLSVTGPLGGSGHGRHASFVPRLAEGRALAGMEVVHAAMDLSDGLSRDLPRLCAASGVGARIEAERLPVHPDVGAAGDERSPLEHALHDGEDFELLVAHGALDEAQRARLEAAGVSLVEIGRVRPAAEGIRLARAGGTLPIPAGGWDHFRRWEEEA